MKVCTFEPAVGCQARSGAKLSTSSLLFDRAILFMSPSANYRLDGTVTQYDARDKLVIHRDEYPSACGKHGPHIPFPRARNDTTHVNLAARQWLQSSGLFWQSPIFFLAIPNLSVSPFGAICSPFRNRQGNNACVIMRNKICSIGRSKGGCYG